MISIYYDHKLRRCISVILLSIIISMTPLVDYSTAQATGADLLLTAGEVLGETAAATGAASASAVLLPLVLAVGTAYAGYKIYKNRAAISAKFNNWVENDLSPAAQSVKAWVQSVIDNPSAKSITIPKDIVVATGGFVNTHVSTGSLKNIGKSLGKEFNFFDVITNCGFETTYPKWFNDTILSRNKSYEISTPTVGFASYDTNTAVEWFSKAFYDTSQQVSDVLIYPYQYVAGDGSVVSGWNIVSSCLTMIKQTYVNCYGYNNCHSGYARGSSVHLNNGNIDYWSDNVSTHNQCFFSLVGNDIRVDARGFIYTVVNGVATGKYVMPILSDVSNVFVYPNVVRGTSYTGISLDDCDIAFKGTASHLGSNVVENDFKTSTATYTPSYTDSNVLDIPVTKKLADDLTGYINEGIAIDVPADGYTNSEIGLIDGFDKDGVTDDTTLDPGVEAPVDTTTSILDSIKSLPQKFFDFLSSLFGAMIANIALLVTMIKALPETLVNGWNRIIEAIQALARDGISITDIPVIGGIASTISGILDTVIALPNTITESVTGALERVFVPDAVVVEDICNTFESSLEERVGILTYPLAISIGFLLKLPKLDNSDCILVIPKLQLDDNVYFKGYSYNLSENVRKWGDYYNILKVCVDAIMIFGVLGLARKKLYEFLDN